MINLITSLLNGCALVIDDEINEKHSSISKIITTLEAEGTLFAKYDALPSDNAFTNLSGFSFIILDWDIKSDIKIELPDGVDLGITLNNTITNTNIAFIKKVLKSYFIPIFIFSRQNIDSINSNLESDEEIKPDVKQRVFVKSKEDLTGKKVKTYLINWLKQNKTIFALKMYEEQLNKSKNAFLVEAGGLNSEWANLVYNTIKLDHIGDDKKPIHYLLNLEFRDFFTNAMLGRMESIKFDEVKFLIKPRNIQKNHINSIFESVKFYRYSESIDNGQAYEGDIYQRFENNQFKNDYLVNINAPCDIRKEKILFLQGKTKEKLRESGISFFSLPCFAQKPSIEFRYDNRYRIDKPVDLSTITVSCKDKSGEEQIITYKRIGRLIHPYITAIRSEFAHFISRQGLPRHPKQQ